MLEKYHSYRNKWQRGIGKEGCLCGWKGIGSVEMYLLGHVKVSWQTTPGNSVMAICIVCPYLSTQLCQQSLPQSNSDRRWCRPGPWDPSVLFRVPCICAKAGKMCYCWGGRILHTRLFLLALLSEGCQRPEAGMPHVWIHFTQLSEIPAAI